ncbi:hypothetical protein [Sulfurovum sp.]|uniref:hypothetical protein n=1 Tax=Sulfurovum sp. TaxID=1969726 RepID=UPI0035643B78
MKKLVFFLSFATVAFAFMDTARCNNYKSHANEYAIKYKISYEDKDKRGMKNALGDFLYWNKEMISVCDKTTADEAYTLRKAIRKNPNALLDVNIKSISNEEAIQNEVNNLLNVANSDFGYNQAVCDEASKNEKIMLFGITIISQEDDSNMSKEELKQGYEKLENEFLKHNQLVITNCPPEQANKARERQQTVLKVLEESKKQYGI